jgi:hypothetical protein
MPYGTDQKYYRTPQCSQRTNDLLLAPEMTETIYNSFSIDIEQVGFELTCGAVSMRARFAHDTELLLIKNCTTKLLAASASERVHAAPAG